MPAVSFQNVSKTYTGDRGALRALDDVSFDIRKGEFFGLLGPNGAGKTTIMKTISGILDPRRGSVHFRGENITAPDPAQIVRLGLSHVPEGREVFPLLTVE